MQLLLQWTVVGLVVLVFASWMHRLAGLRFSVPRSVVAGVISVAVTGPIAVAIGGPSFGAGESFTPGFWFLLLGAMCGLVCGLVFLVVLEALVPSGSVPGPIYTLRSWRRRGDRGKRYLRISRIILRRGLGPFLRGARRAELRTPQGRQQIGRRVAAALEEAGVTFVKLGQVLSTRADLIPPEFVAELERLQDDAATMPWSEIEPVLIAEWGVGWREHFRSVETTPLAAASIAQVYGAVLVDGQEVVIKVCRPGAAAVAEQDLDIIAQLAGTAQERTSWGRAMGVVDLAQGFAEALREEFDLRIEAANTASVAAADGPEVVIPQVRQELCTEKVLVSARLRGVPLSAAAGRLDALGVDRSRLAALLLDTVLKQVLVNGIFHADPHPGNVLLLEDGRLGLLDFGSVGRLDDVARAALQRLLWAMDKADSARFADALLELVDAPETVDERQVQRAAGAFLTRHLAGGQQPGSQLFADVFALLTDHHLAVPPPLAAVLRTLGTLEGTVAHLDPTFDMIGRAKAFGAEFFAEQLSPDALRRRAWDELIALGPVLARLPRRLDRITAAMENGEFTARIRLFSDDRDRRWITSVVQSALLTFLAAAVGVMAVMLIGLQDGPRITDQVGVYQFMGYCLLVVAAILGLRVLAGIFRQRGD